MRLRAADADLFGRGRRALQGGACAWAILALFAGDIGPQRCSAALRLLNSGRRLGDFGALTFDIGLQGRITFARLLSDGLRLIDLGALTIDIRLQRAQLLARLSRCSARLSDFGLRHAHPRRPNSAR